MSQHRLHAYAEYQGQLHFPVLTGLSFCEQQPLVSSAVHLQLGLECPGADASHWLRSVRL